MWKLADSDRCAGVHGDSIPSPGESVPASGIDIALDLLKGKSGQIWVLCYMSLAIPTNRVANRFREFPNGPPIEQGAGLIDRQAKQPGLVGLARIRTIDPFSRPFFEDFLDQISNRVTGGRARAEVE